MFKEAYNKSLQKIVQCNIKNETEYNKIAKEYLLLNSESMKYISQKRNFKKIIRIAKAVN